jgi:hypothetical protein
MLIWSTILFAATVTVQSQEAEGKKIPDDSVQITATGCLKKRVFTATGRDEREAEIDVKRGPDVTGRSFRLAGPRDVMNEVKKQDGRFVEIVGIVRKAALDDQQPGMKVGNTRITIGAPSTVGQPGGIHADVGARPGIPVMDATAVRFLGESCPLDNR